MLQILISAAMLHVAFSATATYFIQTINNSNTDSITTIVGCDNSRNTDSSYTGSYYTLEGYVLLVIGYDSIGYASFGYRLAVSRQMRNSSSIRLNSSTQTASPSPNGQYAAGITWWTGPLIGIVCACFMLVVLLRCVRRCSQELQTIARNIAKGSSSCYNYPNKYSADSYTGPFLCPASKGTYTFNSTSGVTATYTGKKRRAVKQRRAATVFTATTNAQQGIGNCGYSINSIYIEEIVGNYRVIASNGIPDHNYAQNTPDTPCEQYKIMIVLKSPSNPTGSGSDTGLGVIGLSKSGSPIYNHRSGETLCDAAYASEVSTFGTCYGHSSGTGEWHYHGPSSCLKTSANDLLTTTETCPIIGYLLDGYPIRSECSTRTTCYGKTTSAQSAYNCTVYVNGATKATSVFPGCDTADYTFSSTSTCQLDAANGYTESDSYTYYFTDSYPYTPPKLMGTQGYLCVAQLS